MIKIILVRHGQTIKNKAGLAQSHTDSDFTQEGLIQIEKTKEFLKNHKIDAVFSSDLGRAVKTAEKICECHKVRHILDKNLRELNWGDFMKFPTDQLLTKWSEFYDSERSKGIAVEEIRPKNGENSFDHIIRVKKVLDIIIKDYKNKVVLVVAHGGTNKVLIGILNKSHVDEFYKIKQDNACINLLELDDGGNLISSKLNETYMIPVKKEDEYIKK
jgi:broad specificity phosphatase PhoE